MQRIFIALLSLLLLTPAPGFAAFNDVTLTTDTDISVGGITLDVTGSSATIESITVNADNFSFVLQPGSYIQVTSADRREMSTDAATEFIETNICNGSQSVLKHSASIAGGGGTITITPTATTCSDPTATPAAIGGTSAPGAAGGGGGGGGYTPLPTIQVASAAQALASLGPSYRIPTVAFFTRALSQGASNLEVRELQKLLNSDPDTQVAVSGPGSPGNESNYFGALTARAVEKFQEKYGIAGPGDPGYGTVGPKTRAKLNELLSGGTSVPTTSSSAGEASSDTGDLERQLLEATKQLKILQDQLNTGSGQ